MYKKGDALIHIHQEINTATLITMWLIRSSLLTYLYSRPYYIEDYRMIGRNISVVTIF